MNIEELIQETIHRLAPWTQSHVRPEEDRLDVVIHSQDLPAAIGALLIPPQHGYLSAITGLDHPPLEESGGQVEVLYTFCAGPAILTLRTSVSYEDPVLPTVCDLIPSATIYEREMIEMFGVTITGTPNTDRLLLPDDWPDGVYPLRKSFTGFKQSEQAGKGPQN